LGSGGPEKNLFRIPDPGVKKAPDPGFGSFVTLSPSNRLLPVKDICNAGSGLSEEEKQAYQAEIKSLKERMLASKFQYCIAQPPFLIIILEENRKKWK
jgi:hypothetical protein